MALLVILACVVLVLLIAGNRSRARQEPQQDSEVSRASERAPRSSADAASATRRKEVAPSVPPLPEVAIAIQPAAPGTVAKVPSFSMTSNAVYDCDLSALTCTCAEFAVHRTEVPVESPLRPCKHLRPCLMEGGLVTLGESDAEALWRERGGRLFRWVSETGQTVYLSVDPTREWINVAPVRARRTEESEDFGWSVDEQRWSYGRSPRGFARALAPALHQMAERRANMLRELGGDVERRWERNRLAFEAREQAKEEALEQAAQAIGLCCGVCGTPLGQPFGTPVGTELPCTTCGFPNLVIDEGHADAAERALIDWKYYDDPRPGGGKRLLTAEKERHAAERASLEARFEAGGMSPEAFIAERNRLESGFSERFNALHQQRHAELAEIRRRIGNTKARLKHRAERARRASAGRVDE